MFKSFADIMFFFLDVVYVSVRVLIVFMNVVCMFFDLLCFDCMSVLYIVVIFFSFSSFVDFSYVVVRNRNVARRYCVLLFGFIFVYVVCVYVDVFLDNLFLNFLFSCISVLNVDVFVNVVDFEVVVVFNSLFVREYNDLLFVVLYSVLSVIDVCVVDILFFGCIMYVISVFLVV